jgi:hypothetical protein
VALAPQGPAGPPPQRAPHARGHLQAPHDGPARARRVHRLDPDQRQQLGMRIAAAIAKARAAKARTAKPTPGPDAEDPLIPLEQVGKPLQDGLTAAIPLLAKCYGVEGAARAKTAAAQLTMISDPALGTVIDTDAVTDADGSPLSKQLDDCLRDTIESLELPPLGQTGKVKLEYTFRFD